VSGLGGDEEPGPGPEGPGPTDVPFDASARMGDRAYVTSVLTGLFVPDSASSGDADRIAVEAAVNANVGSQFIDFGGACDQLLVDRAATDPCSISGRINEGLTRVPGFVSNTSVRSALALRAIYAALNPGTANNMALKNVIALSRGVTYASVVLASVARPQRFELSNLFQRLYPGQTPSEGTLDKLEALSTSASTAVDAWRFTAIAVLSSLLWQIP